MLTKNSKLFKIFSSIIILIFFSINFSFAINNTKLEKIKIKLEKTEYKNKISRIDILVKKTNIKKLETFNKNIKKLLSKNKIKSDKKLLLAYIYYKILEKKDNIILLEKEEEKDKIIEKNNYNGTDISNKLKQKHLQNMPLSCEISATSDILSYFQNKKIDESEILKILKKSHFNKLPKRKKNGDKIWGNPQKGFVGYMNKLPNGKEAMQGYMTGYGVLENPITEIYKKYGYKTKILKNGNISNILEELEKGNMIQLWGDICTNPKFYNGKEIICKTRGRLTWNSRRALNWKYLDENGKFVKYTGLNGEHAFYLLGYKGNYLNPTHIIVWDTMTGKHTYPTSEWMRKWGKMQYRSIVIYKK